MPPTSKSSIVLVTDVPFWKQSRGSHKRIRSLVNHLRQRAKLEYFFVGQLGVGAWQAAENALEQRIHGPGAPGWYSRFRQFFIREAPAGNDLSLARSRRMCEFHSEAIGKSFADFLQRNTPTHIVIEYVSLAFLFDFVPDHLRSRISIAIDTHDVMHFREQEFRRNHLDHWLTLSAEEETRALGQADFVLAIQERDAEMFRQMLGIDESDSSDDRTQVVVVKQPTAWLRTFPALPHRGGVVHIGFVGSDGDANRLAIGQFVEHVWPRTVQKLGANVRLLIAGSICNKIPEIVERGDAKIELLGEVDLARRFYPQIDIAVNPTQINSGLKIKSLEAVSFGVPLVTTTAGAAGLEHGLNQCLVAADDWTKFADAIVSLARAESTREQFTHNAKSLIEREFSSAEVFKELDQAFFSTRS